MHIIVRKHCSVKFADNGTIDILLLESLRVAGKQCIPLSVLFYFLPVCLLYQNSVHRQ